MDDFIFGTLATDALRLAEVRKRRAGVTHANARFPRDPLPGQPVILELTVGPEHAANPDIAGRPAWVYWTIDGTDPDGAAGTARRGQALPMEAVDVAWDMLLWGYVRRYQVVLPGQEPDTVVRYRLAYTTPQGEIFADGDAGYAYYVAEDPLPEWTRDAIIYQIFVDRFFPGEGRAWQRPKKPSGFYGGTLRGITERLDYLAGLGVNVIWLTPVFPSPSHHGYDATDYLEIEPRLGTKADLRALLDSAHARGIRVLLDFVANHWSWEHPTFQAALADANSPYAAWYKFHPWPDTYASFFGVQSLPQVNLRSPEARRYMLEAASYWLEFGVDGYRLDYAVGPSFDFWAGFRRATRQARPDCWSFGEVVEPPDAQIAFEGLLDGCLDFNLLEALRQTFAFSKWDATRLAEFLDRHEAFFPADFSRPAFLDNHDMNRILWVLGGDRARLKLAALCQFTLSGPPLIYYGTEVGLSQERDVRQGRRGLPEEARLPMLWGEGQDQDLLAFYKELIALRRSSAALRRGARRTLHASADTLAYQREAAGQTLAVAFNLAAEPRTLRMPGAWATCCLATGAGWTLKVEADSTLVTLPALTGVILE